MASLEEMFRNMFTWMNVGGTRQLVREHARPVKVHAAKPEVIAKIAR